VHQTDLVLFQHALGRHHGHLAEHRIMVVSVDGGNDHGPFDPRLRLVAGFCDGLKSLRPLLRF